MSKPIKVVFEGEAGGAVAAFDKVGDSSRRMSDKVDASTTAHTRLGERIGTNESKFMGAADLLDGLGGAFGLPTEGATQLARGLGDLSGGFEVVSGLIPAISGMFPALGGAMSTLMANPLILGIAAGGAIIVGLVLLEKKFGIVSGAIGALGDGLKWVWDNAIRPTLNLMIGGIELWLKAMTAPLNLFNKVPLVKNLIPDAIANVKLPRLDVGGSVLQTGLAVVHRGEVVTSATGTPVAGGGGNHYHFHFGGDVISEGDFIRKARDGLARDKRWGG